jgi:GTP-binding protein HflX
MAKRRRAGTQLEREQAPLERVLLVGAQFGGVGLDDVERSLDELAALVESAGAAVAGRIVQRRDRPDPATFIGKGKAADVAAEANRAGADTTVFDDELSAAQLRNLEDLVPGKVIDRTALILDIFAQRAHSMEGRKQVELAQLLYGLPRLRGWGTVMSRLGGGIGTRGPGETKLEIDRRRIERRITKLRRDLKDLSKQRALRRKRREATVATISLVGYTNAGKSTLLNHLTDARVLVEDQLFSTLDPTARRLRLEDGRTIVLTDTVGFIRKLPHGLVESFQSTLEEVAGADVLVHVVDGSRPDPEIDIAAVDEVLHEIGAMSSPRVIALNKADILDAHTRARLCRRLPDAVAISAHTGEGVDDLLRAVARELDARVVEVEAFLPYEQGALLARLHEQGRVVETHHEEGGVRVLVRARSNELASLSAYVSR